MYVNTDICNNSPYTLSKWRLNDKRPNYKCWGYEKQSRWASGQVQNFVTISGKSFALLKAAVRIIEVAVPHTLGVGKWGGKYGVFRRFRKIAKSDFQLRHVCPSVRLHGTNRLPLKGFAKNLIFENFLKTSRENSSFITIGEEKKGTLHKD